MHLYLIEFIRNSHSNSLLSLIQFKYIYNIVLNYLFFVPILHVMLLVKH